jgi:hypothetical protein
MDHSHWTAGFPPIQRPALAKFASITPAMWMLVGSVLHLFPQCPEMSSATVNFLILDGYPIRVVQVFGNLPGSPVVVALFQEW